MIAVLPESIMHRKWPGEFFNAGARRRPSGRR